MPVLVNIVHVPASPTKFGSKLKPLAWRHCLPYYTSMATTVLMESAPKLKRSLSPIPLMIHIKFDQDWPTDLLPVLVTSKFVKKSNQK